MKLRYEISSVIAAQCPDSTVVAGDAVAAWDLLDDVDHVVGLLVPECDALTARLPSAWREEFLDRIIALAHDLLDAGKPVFIGVASEGRLTAAFERLHSTRLTELNAARGLVVFEGRVIQLCSVQSSPASPAYDDAHAIERRRVKMRSFDEVVEAAAGFVTVVAAVPGRWVQNPDSHLRVLTIEAFLSERYAAVAALVNPGECAQAGGVIIDGCSAAEFRAMRLSSRGLPPPLPGTVFWVDDFGLIERVEAPGS